MVAEIRKANGRSIRVDEQREPITVYEAVMIDRGDREVQEMGEIRTAAQLSLRFQNSLGSVEGDSTVDNTPVVRATLQGKVAELITRNAGYAHTALNGLQEVVTLAAADKGNYTKTVIFISPGFVTGKGSRGDVSGPLQSIAAQAQQQHVKILTVDIGGAASETPVVDPIIGGYTDAPRLPQMMAAHVTASIFEKSSSLDTLSLGSGAKRVKADNDIAAAVDSAFAANGALYYLAFLSRQPADGRYHRIALSVSSRSVRLHARPGYYARPQTERASMPASGASNEEVNATLTRADEAMKNHDYAAVATALETLKWKFQDKPDFWYNLGVAYFNLKDSLKAAEALEQAWALSPEDRSTGLMLSRALAAGGNEDAAVQTLLTMRSRNPLDLEILIQLGRVYEAASKPAAAYEVYRTALDLNPSLPLEFYVVLIRTSALLGREAEAGVFVERYRSHGGAEEAIAPWTRLMRRSSKTAK